MAWSTYHTKIQVSTGGVTYTLPVDSLSVQAVPFSRSGSTAVELFDGRMKQRIDGWRYEVSLSWRELKTSDNGQLFDAVKAIATNGSCVIDFDPSNPGTKTIDVILRDAAGAIQALFNGMVRSRSASVAFTSSGIDTAPKSWITT